MLKASIDSEEQQDGHGQSGKTVAYTYYFNRQMELKEKTELMTLCIMGDNTLQLYLHTMSY